MAELRKNNPLWGESLRAAGVKTIVLFPLEYNGDTYGYIWALDFNTKNTSKIKEALELATFFIASEVANLRLVQKLKRLSSVDLLTGVMNRNAMNNRVDSIVHCDKKSKPVGVIFTDINGLKYVNDHEGHNAGDILIKSAAAVLNDICGENEIYRAGGDEFMIIAVGIPRDVLEGRIEALRRESDDPANVSFALGLCYEDSRGDIRNAMRSADERMYADKEQYYRRYPERRKR
jgi:diguanylate cyclase (GGDEF)-like protein